MTTLPNYYYNVNSEILKDIVSLNEKIEKEKNPEKMEKLLMQRMCRGFDLNSGFFGRIKNGYYPY